VAGAVLGTACEELKRIPKEEFVKQWKEPHYLSRYMTHGGRAS